jgi:transcriptional regulator
MYVRTSHQPRQDADVVAAIKGNMFATLVTCSGGDLVASHLPFVFDETIGEHGVLYAHMARANRQGEVLGGGEALVIFTGPHAYISPSWYVDRHTAPTWDYVAVHCYGTPRIHSPEETFQNIERLIGVVEKGRPAPWSIDELSEQEVHAMLANVISFEIPLARIEAKFKLNQGEMRERTTMAVRELEEQGQSELAAYIRRYNDL